LPRALACLLSAVSICAFAAPLLAQTATPAFIEAELPSLVDTYKTIHAHPELSHFEANTSALLAGELRKAGYSVTERVGVYPDGSRAYGVVGVLKNGAGPTLLIRADMDALPIIEETGVPYASHVMAKNKSGQEVGVMHACGHDVHTTVLMGTARALAADKAHWHGTLILIGQPSEETIDGARAMLADHLYERFGRPDMIIGLHDGSSLAAGQVGVRPASAQASSTSVDVTIRGIGGHGAFPNAGRDPMTVGDIHGGTKRNIIPDEVKLELTVRTFSEKSRQVVLEGLRQMAIGVATSAGLPPDKMPTVTVLENETAPLTYNDPALTARVKSTLVQTFGAANVIEGSPVMASEDVGTFSLNSAIPMCYFALGAAYPDRLAAARAAGKELPGPHTSKFEPDPAPTVETGVTALTEVALSLLK
jgi:hippurate hydrolase